MIYVVEERDVSAERGQRSEQQRLIAFARESVGKGARVGGVHVPFAPVRRDGFEMAKLAEHRSCRLGSPAWQARIAVGRVTDECEVVGDRCRQDAELLDHSSLVPRHVRSAIQLNDARTAHALGQVLIRRADDHAFDARIASCRHGRRSENRTLLTLCGSAS